MPPPKQLSPPDCPICASSTRPLAPVDRYPLHVCNSCGLEFLYPQPDATALIAIYGEHYFDAWGVNRNEAATRALKMATFRRRLTGVRNRLPESARVLDVGCATGYFLEAAKEFGLEPYGVELSEYGAEVTRKKFGTARVHQGELESARFDDFRTGQFDAIFMSDLIEHVRDPQSTLTAAHRWLSPTGLLVITTPWTGSISHQLAGRYWLHYKPEHLYYFGADSLRRLLNANGFELVNTTVSEKCLSLGYAASQFSAGALPLRFIACLLSYLPTRLLDRHLWLRIGEVTLVAKPTQFAAYETASA